MSSGPVGLPSSSTGRLAAAASSVTCPRDLAPFLLRRVLQFLRLGRLGDLILFESPRLAENNANPQSPHLVCLEWRPSLVSRRAQAPPLLPLLLQPRPRALLPSALPLTATSGNPPHRTPRLRGRTPPPPLQPSERQQSHTPPRPSRAPRPSRWHPPHCAGALSRAATATSGRRASAPGPRAPLTPIPSWQSARGSSSSRWSGGGGWSWGR